MFLFSHVPKAVAVDYQAQAAASGNQTEQAPAASTSTNTSDTAHTRTVKLPSLIVKRHTRRDVSGNQPGNSSDVALLSNQVQVITHRRHSTVWIMLALRSVIRML
jgi:hypothetical protein